MDTWKRVADTRTRLKEAMDATGKKQADLVRETGLNKSTISRYVVGEMEPKQSAINKLAIALDVSETWLYGYDVPMARSKEQKKNDDLVKVIAQLRVDPDFLDMVKILSSLSADERAKVKPGILVMCEMLKSQK